MEPDAGTYNLDAALVEAAITPPTRVVLPVHLYGQPADMDAIVAVASRHGLAVLDDCAQAGSVTVECRTGLRMDTVSRAAYDPAPFRFSEDSEMPGFLSLHGRPTVATEYKGIPECALPGQHAAIFEIFRRAVPAGSCVLDLASGQGAWAQRLSDNG